MKTKTRTPAADASIATTTNNNTPVRARNTKETAMNTEQPRPHFSSLSTPADPLAAECPVRDPSRASQWDSLYVSLLDRLRPELDAIAPSELLTPNVDVPTAIHYARSALPVLELLRPQAESLGSNVDMKLYDRVGDYARLLQYAHGSYLATLSTPDTVAQTYERAVTARDFLLAWGQALVSAGLLPQSLIDQVRVGIGFQDAITDLTVLSSALRAIWPQIEGQTMIKASQLDEADAVAEKLAEGVALRDSLVETLTKRATDRQLAFTLFCKAYAEARATAVFLRRKEGDGDKLVPSIYSKAPGARRKEEPAEPAPVEPVKEPVKPAPADATKPAGAVKDGEDLPPNQNAPFAFPVKG